MKKTAIYNFFTALLALTGLIIAGTAFAADAKLKDIAETEIAVSELKLKQLVQKIGWSEEKSAASEKLLMTSPFYLKARDEFFGISRAAAESKRRLELAEASAGRVDPELELRVLEQELKLKKAALQMENARLEHYFNENTQSSYLDVKDAFGDFNRSRNEYFSQLQNWVLFAATEDIAGNYFNFRKFESDVEAEIKAIFVSDVMSKLNVTKEIASFYWDEYVKDRADFSGLFGYFRRAALQRIKDDLAIEFTRVLSQRERARILVLLEGDPEVINMVRDGKRSLVKNMIHEKLKDEIVKLRSELFKRVVKRDGADLRKAYPDLKSMLLEYRKNAGPLPADFIIEQEIIPDEREYIETIDDLLQRLSVLRRQKLKDSANLNRYYMWGEKSNWPINGIQVLREALKEESSELKVEEMDMIAQLSADIALNKMNFEKYSRYYFRVMDAGGGFDAGAFVSRPAAYEQERSVLANSAYSYAQAKKLFDEYKKLRREFENYSRKINNLLDSGENKNGRAADLGKRMDDVYKSYFSGTDTVERVFNRMAERLGHYALREDDLLEAAGSMPDGLDPMFVGRVRGIR